MTIKIQNLDAIHFADPIKGMCKYDKYETYKFREQESETLFKVMPIKESINYRCLKENNFKEYEAYNKFINNLKRNKNYFVDLYQSTESLKEKITLFYRLDTKRFLILDGLHRLCILLWKKKILDEINEKDTKIFFSQESIDFLKKELIRTTGVCEENKSWWNRTDNGYHSFNIGNINIKGQRTPLLRLEVFRKVYNFENKTVLDLGCNNGAMLFHLTEIKKGLGIDIDSRCINCANNIKKIFNFQYDLNFEKKDLENEINFKEKFDVVFLLSLGSWIKGWKNLYYNVSKISRNIFLETNNDKEGAEQLNLMNHLGYKINLIINKSKDDNTGNLLRKTYFLNK